jgi:hypothetical protein
LRLQPQLASDLLNRPTRLVNRQSFQDRIQKRV